MFWISGQPNPPEFYDKTTEKEETEEFLLAEKGFLALIFIVPA